MNVIHAASTFALFVKVSAYIVVFPAVYAVHTATSAVSNDSTDTGPTYYTAADLNDSFTA